MYVTTSNTNFLGGASLNTCTVPQANMVPHVHIRFSYRMDAPRYMAVKPKSGPPQRMIVKPEVTVRLDNTLIIELTQACPSFSPSVI